MDQKFLSEYRRFSTGLCFRIRSFVRFRGIDSDGMFHFNLGWYGYADGYYPLNAILTIETDETISLNLGPASLLKRLKWLDLKNIDSNTLDLIAHNNQLFHLDLTRCPVSNFDFLTGLTGLLSLKLCDLPVSNTDIFSKLLSIKQLTISGCNLSYAGFIQNWIYRRRHMVVF